MEYKKSRKIIHLIITDKSQKMIDEINQIAEYFKKKIFENIPKEDLEITERTLKKVIYNVENLL